MAPKYKELWDDFEKRYQDALISQSGERRHDDELISTVLHSDISPEQKEQRIHEIARSRDQRKGKV